MGGRRRELDPMPHASEKKRKEMEEEGGEEVT
jgi:hypothetical protein